MKKLRYFFIVCVVIIMAACDMNQENKSVIKFNPDLIDFYADGVKSERMPPYGVVFRRGGKTLVYLAERHGARESYDMINYCFDDKAVPRPDVVLIEFENSGRPINLSSKDMQFKNGMNTLEYMARRAKFENENIPVWLVDLSAEQMLGVLRELHPDTKFDSEKLHNILKTGPIRSKGENGVLCDELTKYGRDKYMVAQIAKALNENDVVWCIFGEGHFQTQYHALVDMMGQPEFVTSMDTLYIQKIFEDKGR